MEYKIAAACFGAWVCLGLRASIRRAQTLVLLRWTEIADSCLRNLKVKEKATIQNPQNSLAL